MKLSEIRKFIFVEPKCGSPNVYSDIQIPRTGAVLLATILMEAGFDTKVFCEDLCPIDENELFSADVIGISALTNTARPAYELADRCRGRGIPVVMGGTHATFMPDEALDHCDFVVKGEGEQPLIELLQALVGRLSFADILNLSYWSGGERGRGKKVHNPKRDLVQDLNVFPIPDFRLVYGWNNNCIASIMTSRGCPFDCNFCSVTAMLGRGYRYTSEDRVIDELNRYRDHNYIFFSDDNFAVNKRRTKNILRRKIKENLDVKWSAQVRAEISNDSELVSLMRDSNCFNVYIGFESFNPKTLALYNKKMDVDQIHRSMEIFHKYNVKVHGMFVLGSDEDDVDSLRNTVHLAKKLEIDTAQFMILTPLPGTKITKDLREEGRIRTQDWDLFDGHFVTYEPRRITPYELQRETIRAFRRFYSLPRTVSCLMKGDKWTALLRFAARKYLRQWFLQNKSYLRKLREEVLSEVLLLDKRGRKMRKNRLVALPDGFFSEQLQRFLLRFFRWMGVKVIPIKMEVEGEMKELAHRVSEVMLSLRKKTDLLVLLPVGHVWPYATSFDSFYVNKTKLIQPSLFLLPIDSDGTPNYLALARVGMVFTKKLKKIKRAYDDAIKEMRIKSPPILPIYKNIISTKPDVEDS